MEVAHWQQRLFKNTYTYKGRRFRVNGWAVKIQLSGKRKTFALSSIQAEQAAEEACQIYQTIVAHGWKAIPHGRVRAPSGTPMPAGPATAFPSGETNESYWKNRLIQRRYPETMPATGPREFSVRIEHAGMSRYFPLGTTHEAEAATQAMRIHRVVVGKGWPKACQQFRVEVTLAFRWLDDPLAWTYTTLHTQNHSNPPRPREAAEFNVAIVEPDAGIRFALAACVNRQERFCCPAAFADAAQALRELRRQQIHLVLVNTALTGQLGAVSLEEMRRQKPDLIGLLYSVFEESSTLFRDTPGGAVGYMLKRTPPGRIFDPLVAAGSTLTEESVATLVREYFRRLVAALPAGPSALDLARLTPREHQILDHLSKGALAKEIADALGISIWTVHGHIKSIFEKLGVHSRTEAVVKFLQK